MKKVIFLNAGHSYTEPGAVTEYGKESEINMKIRDALVPELEGQGFTVEQVPDDLDYKESYAWVNERSSNINDGLALDIHCNKGGKSGAEAYYYAGSSASREIAKSLVDVYSKELGIENGGPKPDTQSWHGELAWIRKTNPWAVLIECGYMDSDEDMVMIVGHYAEVARAICKGVCAIYGISYENALEVDREKIKAQIILLLQRL